MQQQKGNEDGKDARANAEGPAETWSRILEARMVFSITEENKQDLNKKRELSFSDVKFKMLKDSCIDVQQVVTNVTLQDDGMYRSKI